MSNKYKILQAEPDYGTFVIEFEGLPARNYWIPRDENGYLTGEALEQAIQSYYPAEEIAQLNSFKSLANADVILGMVEQKPVVEIAEETAQPITPVEDVIRAERNKLLVMSDWTQLLDSPLSAEKKAEWAIYRQSLRDISSQPGFPETVDFPLAP